MELPDKHNIRIKSPEYQPPRILHITDSDWATGDPFCQPGSGASSECASGTSASNACTTNGNGVNGACTANGISANAGCWGSGSSATDS